MSSYLCPTCDGEGRCPQDGCLLRFSLWSGSLFFLAIGVAVTKFFGVGSLPYWGWFSGFVAFGLVYVIFLRQRTCPICSGEGVIELVELEEQEELEDDESFEG